MCEVTRSSLDNLFPLIEKAIKQADFIGSFQAPIRTFYIVADLGAMSCFPFYPQKSVLCVTPGSKSLAKGLSVYFYFLFFNSKTKTVKTWQFNRTVCQLKQKQSYMLSAGLTRKMTIRQHVPSASWTKSVKPTFFKNEYKVKLGSLGWHLGAVAYIITCVTVQHLPLKTHCEN